MNVNGFEIEHKYLIAMPDEALLAEGDRSAIVQTYLLGEEGTTERVRMRRYADRTEYTHTTKIRLSAVRRVELEETVGQSEYEALLKRADPARRPIEKQRFCLPYEGRTLEIDVFPFWRYHALLEVELEDEGQPFLLPPEIRVIREVSDDLRYTNAALSLEIPDPNAD
ncbi:MAG: hypothetical protein K6F56_02010 [Oscillospiraceae bacterium]|nr:hypothetical protein [Oscillospiraceae bacterium]